ncbi:FAD-dependent monooxygenase [Kitasatospora sp. NPDC004289]
MLSSDIDAPDEGTPDEGTPHEGTPATEALDTDVLVVGGSTVGLFTALFLARTGVRTLVAERHPAPLAHPRAMGIGPRTVELLHTAGIADAVDAECMDMRGGDLQMFATPTLAEADLEALSAQAPPRTDAFRDVTPRHLRGTCPQGRLDKVIAAAARGAGARIEFGTEMVAFAQDDARVTAQLTGPDGPVEVRARYLVAADGARSGVRESLGIGTSGPGVIGDPLISVLFHADLGEFTGGRPFTVCDITTPEAAGGLLPVDGDREWIYAFRYPRDAGLTPDDFTPQRCAERIRAAVGREDLPLEVVSILPWQVRGALADRFRDGRVFLAGDAAHVIPPVGAFGMNTGAADAHNLAWKLAHVLGGQAGEALLDSYEHERRPVAATALEQSMLRLEDPSLHWQTGEQGRRHRASAGAVNAPVIHLGYRYDSGAVIGPVAPLPSTEDVEPDLDGSPGSRLPHHWLAPGGRTRSTLDLVDYRFTLLAGPDGAAWPKAAAEVASRLGVPVDAHLVEAAAESVPSWAAAVGIEDGGALLVRPDGFVGWRTRAPAADPEAELADVLTALLDRARAPRGSGRPA